jgi:hypothetical protein
MRVNGNGVTQPGRVRGQPFNSFRDRDAAESAGPTVAPAGWRDSGSLAPFPIQETSLELLRAGVSAARRPPTLALRCGIAQTRATSAMTLAA